MTHKLKPGHAVKCKTKEEWTDIIYYAIMHDIEIGSVVRFQNYPYLYLSNAHTLLSTDDIRSFKRYTGMNVNLLSIEDFKAKIDGSYKEPVIPREFADSIPPSLIINECEGWIKYKGKTYKLVEEN